MCHKASTFCIALGAREDSGDAPGDACYLLSRCSLVRFECSLHTLFICYYCSPHVGLLIALSENSDPFCLQPRTAISPLSCRPPLPTPAKPSLSWLPAGLKASVTCSGFSFSQHPLKIPNYFPLIYCYPQATPKPSGLKQLFIVTTGGSLGGLGLAGWFLLRALAVAVRWPLEVEQPEDLTGHTSTTASLRQVTRAITQSTASWKSLFFSHHGFWLLKGIIPQPIFPRVRGF